MSNERYAKPRAAVEAKIARFLLQKAKEGHFYEGRRFPKRQRARKPHNASPDHR